MAAPLDGPWAGLVVSAASLDKTTYGQGTTVTRTGLTSWPADRPFFDSTERIWYYNSHASAPSSVTWTPIHNPMGHQDDDGLFTTAEAVSANDLVMVGSTDFAILKATDGTPKAIGVMLNAVAISTAIKMSDIAFYGIVTVVADAAITRGDRLQAGTTAARVKPLNTTTLTSPTHQHLVATMTAAAVAFSGTPARFTDGAGSVVTDGGGANSPRLMIGNDGVNQTTQALWKTDSLAVTISAFTHGKIVGKALESEATPGNTLKMLLCLTG